MSDSKFLERIQGDICGPIQPLSGPLRYFRVLIDASTIWSLLYLVSTRNHTFSKIIAQAIKLEHIILNIKFNQFEWTMLLNVPQELSMTIVWLEEFKLSTLSCMSIHKMV
jgi:hypothetical protein